jgi:hypothetical protein
MKFETTYRPMSLFIELWMRPRNIDESQMDAVEVDGRSNYCGSHNQNNHKSAVGVRITAGAYNRNGLKNKNDHH